jgi:hypothetical protein
MRRQKITMVDPWQITSRGWKAFKTSKSVENFANKYHVHHVYWRGPGNRRILLVDFNHFKECYQEFRKIATKPTATKKYTQSSYKRTTSRRRPTVNRTSYNTGTTGTRRTTTRRSTWSNRPKTRYSNWKSYRKRSYR